MGNASLVATFALNPFQAYEQFTRSVWRDELVYDYLKDLRGLAKLANTSSDALLVRAFVVGVPSKVSREIRAMSKVETLP